MAISTMRFAMAFMLSVRTIMLLISWTMENFFSWRLWFFLDVLRKFMVIESDQGITH
jgi:hypothetical protein